MSRVLKNGTVAIDFEHIINVEIPDTDFFTIEETFEPEPEPKITEEEALSKAELIIKEAEETALKITETAKEEAAVIVAELKEQAVKETDEIKEAARAEAFELGRQEGEAEKERIIKEAEQIKAEAVVQKNKLLNAAEPEVVTLITDLLEKLTGAARDINPGVIKYLVKQGLDATTVAGNISVHVSPADYETVLEAKKDFMALGEAGTHLDIIKDETLNPADCIIETAYGNIDCSLGVQLKGLTENLYYMLYAERTGSAR